MQNALANLNAPFQASSAMAAFQSGQAIGERQRLKKALAAFSVNPDDIEAQQVITELEPRLGAKIREEQQARRFNRAAEGYFTGQTNALAQRSAQPAQGNTNALLPATPPVAPGPTTAPVAAPQGNQPQAESNEELDLSSLGEPQTQQDAAFLEMLRVDAKRAFEIDSEMRDRAADRLKLQRDTYGFAVQRLGGIKNDADYQAALADIQQRIEPLGVQVTQFLPPRFPGPDTLRQIRLGAIEADDQMRLFMQEANIAADNERADRNTDSLIENREGRLGEYRRHNRATEGNTRRGQDLLDSRARRRGSGARSGGRAADRPTATDAQGNKVEWDGKTWVPVQ